MASGKKEPDTVIEMYSEETSTSEDIHEQEDGSDDVDVSTADILSKQGTKYMVLVAESKKICVSSEVLRVMSPVFSSLIEERERSVDNTGVEIDMTGKKASDVQEFLDCMYPNILKPITEENVFAVLQLACEYKVKILVDRCESFLMNTLNESTTSEDLCKYLHQASEFNMQTLRKKCIKLANNKNHDDLTRAEQRFPLHPTDKCEILEGKMEVFDEKIKGLSIQLKESQSECQDLKKAVKAMFNADGGNLRQDRNSIGVLKMTIAKRNPLVFTCEPVLVNKVKWSLSPTFPGTCFVLTLKAEFDDGDKDWQCDVKAKFRILSRDVSANHHWGSLIGTVCSANPKCTAFKIMHTGNLWNSVYTIKSQPVEIEFFFLVGDVHKID